MNGKVIKRQLSDFAARVFQHEFDHLQGTLFHDRFGAAALAKNRPTLVKLEESFLAANPGSQIQRVS